MPDYTAQEVRLAYFADRVDRNAREWGITPAEAIDSQYVAVADSQQRKVRKRQHYVMGKQRLFDTRLVVSSRVIPGTAMDRAWKRDIVSRCPHSAVIVVKAGDRAGERCIQHVGLVKKD